MNVGCVNYAGTLELPINMSENEGYFGISKGINSSSNAFDFSAPMTSPRVRTVLTENTR